MLGVLIALFSGPFIIYVASMAHMMADPGSQLAPEFKPLPSFTPTDSDIAIVLALMLVWAPLAESLIFPPLYWLTRRLPAPKVVFTVLIGVLAYIAHGGMIWNLAQAAGFMLMALWYVHLSERDPSPSLLSPVKIPYYGIVIAHFGWNATAILWPLAIGFLLRLIGA
jgi:hypothetical protein